MYICMYEKDDTLSEKSTIVCDYIAGMTDRFAMTTYKKLFF